VQPAGVAGFADRQRHDHPPVLVAARVAGLPGVQGHRDHRAEDQVLDVFAAAQQQIAQAGGDGGEHDVVDLGTMRAGDVLGQVEAAADDSQPAIRADRLVEAGAGGMLLGEGLAPRRPGAPGRPQRPGRPGQAGQRASKALPAPRRRCR